MPGTMHPRKHKTTPLPSGIARLSSMFARGPNMSSAIPTSARLLPKPLMRQYIHTTCPPRPRPRPHPRARRSAIKATKDAHKGCQDVNAICCESQVSEGSYTARPCWTIHAIHAIHAIHVVLDRIGPGRALVHHHTRRLQTCSYRSTVAPTQLRAHSSGHKPNECHKRTRERAPHEPYDALAVGKPDRLQLCCQGRPVPQLLWVARVVGVCGLRLACCTPGCLRQLGSGAVQQWDSNQYMTRHGCHDVP